MKEIPLSQGKVALVDDEDHGTISSRHWYAWKSVGTSVFYARSCTKPRVFMHRVVMNAPPDQDVDHVNGDGLDNRKTNLRLADDSINQQNRHRLSLNTSGYRGVTWSKSSQKWQASIKRMGKSYHLGVYFTRQDAARAYDEGARRLYGASARTNFPQRAA